jgi:hypothetical protein
LTIGFLATVYGAPALFAQNSVETVVVRSGSGLGINRLVGPCCVPLPGTGPNGSFGATEFNAACQGPAASVVTPFVSWCPSLPADPQARWISAFPARTAGSTLFCQTFTVDSDPIECASIDICFCADDRLGDPAGNGANPIGVYINGAPVSGLLGGGFLTETCLHADHIEPFLVQGTNTLHIYNRDLFATESGVIYSATITIQGQLPTAPVFVGEQLTSNVSSGIPNNTLQVVATYDGNPSPDLALCIQYEAYNTRVQDWITIDASHPFPIGDLGTKFSTYEYDLMNNFPTGRFVVRGVIPNGVPDGVVFGIFWRDNVGGYHMLKSNSAQANTTNDFFGIWPIGFASSAIWAARATGCAAGGNCLIQAQSTLLGAKLLGNGLHSIGIKNDILPGDFDDDCDVDLKDFLEFIQYFTGPGNGCEDCPLCPPPLVGACCLCTSCVDGLTEQDCLLNQGVWVPNATCASINCAALPLPPCPVGGLTWDNNIVPNGVNGRAMCSPAFPNIRVVDDFVIPGNVTLDSVRFNASEDATWTPGISLNVYIYDDTGPGGAPGAKVVDTGCKLFTRTATGVTYFGRANYNYCLSFAPAGIPLAGGAKYWLGWGCCCSGGTGTTYWMTSSGGPDGAGSSTGYFSLDGGNTWQNEGAGWQHAFEVYWH